MRILSQDGKIDVPYEQVSLEIKEKEIWCGYSMTMTNHCVGKMFAEYSSEEKALKAMEMLHEAYVAHENYKKLDAEIQIRMAKELAEEKVMMYGGIFRFPQEDEL